MLVMKLDPLTVRLMYRLTDRLDSIRKSPHRYEIDQADMDELGPVLKNLETLLTRIRTLKAG